MSKNGMHPIHPGEVLREEYLEPLNMSADALARAIGVSAPTVNEIVRERRGITADIALRLSSAFGCTAQFWMNMQSAYELRLAETTKGDEIRSSIKRLDQVA